MNNNAHQVNIKITSHNPVSKARWTMAIKHWKTAGKRFGLLRYSKAQLKAHLDAVEVGLQLRSPPLLRNLIISRKATARR